MSASDVAIELQASILISSRGETWLASTSR
jgi:hypothetical protein